MARVADDIVHYFTQKGVDILNTPSATVLGLCRGEADRIYESLDKRDYPTGDLLAAVITAEQHMELLESEVRLLRKTVRLLKEKE